MFDDGAEGLLRKWGSRPPFFSKGTQPGGDLPDPSLLYLRTIKKEGGEDTLL